MPRSRRRGLARAGELPGTLKRSSKDAQETFTKAHDNAVRAYGEGDQADRATYKEFKRKFEKRGDHWIPKQAGPGDLARAPRLGSAAGHDDGPSVYETEGPRLIRVDLAGYPAVWHRRPPPGPGIRVNRRLAAASRVPEWPSG